MASIFTQDAQVDHLQCWLDNKSLVGILVSPAVASTLTATSTVADVVTGELADVNRVLINDANAPLTATWSAANQRAEATADAIFDNSNASVDRDYGTLVIIYDGSQVFNDTTGKIYVIRESLVTPETLDAQSSRTITVRLGLRDVT